MKIINKIIAERLRCKNKYEEKAILHGVGETLQLFSMAFLGYIYNIHAVSVITLFAFLLCLYGIYEGSYIKNIEHITNMEDVRNTYELELKQYI